MPVSKGTRNDIIQLIKSEGISWSGTIGDVEFLSRIYDLTELPSFDHRYASAKGDITQHRIWAHDWEDNWIFDDSRFDLHNCSDEKFLRFLCETINPVVRPNRKEAELLLEMFNKELAEDGYKLVETTTRFGKIRYEPIGIVPTTIEALELMKDEAQAISSEYLQREIVRMQSALEKDPALAIGTAKEFVESVCKTILNERKKTFGEYEDLPKLVYLTIQEIAPIKGPGISDDASKTARKMLGALSTLVQCLTELRNEYGTGHGKEAKTSTPDPTHAALAVNAATTIAFFLFQSLRQNSSGTSPP
jgi:hypothetical protein